MEPNKERNSASGEPSVKTGQPHCFSKMYDTAKLPGRVETEAEISALLAERPDQNHALLLIDMYGWRGQTDPAERETVKKSVRAASEFLLNYFRKNDIVGHISRDMLVALMVDVPNSRAVEKKIEVLNAAVPYGGWDPHLPRPAFRIGFAMSGGLPCSYGELFQRADETLYRIKRTEGLLPKGSQLRRWKLDASPNSRRRMVLVVDDSAVNRRILRKNLSDEYDIVEAGDGREALNALERYGTRIEVIILDLLMPVMNGFEFLTELQGRSIWKDIPVLVATGSNAAERESQALKLGAWDFVSTPYNMEVLRSRLRNAILRSQMSAFNRLKYLAEYDTVTGIYNKQMFFEMTHDMLLAHPQKRFIFIRFDIEKFKLINSYFGSAAGDHVLRQIAQLFRQYAALQPMMTYGYIYADVFCICMPFLSREEVSAWLALARDQVQALFEGIQISSRFGLYVITDPKMSVDRMYDNAILASEYCKGNYMHNYAFYEESMRAALERESELTGQMVQALEGGQFIVYYQPRYTVDTQRPAGAEALVRWQHPDQGIIPPDEFIPLFERNGFIAQLDSYVWEQACMMLRRRMDAGKPVSPISVNVSRVDLFTTDLIERVRQLVKAYQIPSELFNLEITESAYSDNPHAMQGIVRQLQELGFVIMMDDFGSGYSSLNILKDLPVDVLKIDMRFLPSRPNERAEVILESVVEMAKKLRMSVIVEGVETALQAEYLRKIGCDYIQGYYCGRPMPQDAYERLLDQTPKP